MTNFKVFINRKSVAILLVALILIGFAPLPALAAEAVRVGDYDFDAATGTIEKYYGAGGAVVVPAQIGGVPVTAVGESAFAFCDLLVSVTIPGSVKSIGSGAFAYCKNLTSVTINPGVTTIGNTAFSGCPINRVFIPDSVTTIGNLAFKGCLQLEAITVDGGNKHYKSVNDVLFSLDGKTIIQYPRKKNGESFSIPANVTAIGDSAFAFTSLSNIVIPSGVKTIGPSAFYCCTSLTNIVLPAELAVIREETFSLCLNLTSIVIPDGVKSIEKSAFQNCNKLTEITLPAELSALGKDVLSGCNRLKKITVPKGVSAGLRLSSKKAA